MQTPLSLHTARRIHRVRSAVTAAAVTLMLAACPRMSTDERGSSGPPAVVSSIDPSPATAGRSEAASAARVDCRAVGKHISRFIYGIGLDPNTKPESLSMGATARRWGGNTTSRYNWSLGNAWNTGNDWFFENVAVKPFSAFLAEDEANGLGTALTVPMLGWVAKDTRSASFPVSIFGRQQKADDSRGAGNGRGPDGALLAPRSPDATSTPASPELVARWIQSLRDARQAGGRRSVDIAILDNEPSLWSSTHRDVHPEPLGYDELMRRSVEYAAAIRRADPGVRIAGPAEWGWTGYFYSAADVASGTTLGLDRRAHGDEPLVPWYLRQLRAESERLGVRLLDLLDLHFYPQGEKVYGAADDPRTAALRIRQTRGLWDRSYVDESWIKEPIYLLPRMREWVDRSWPGTGIMVGEWSFGGESHMSGALAIAETLGRFAEYGVDAAFYWTVPPPGSAAELAFRAYRQSDGRGGPFQDFFVPSTATPGTSVFASRDRSGQRLVLVVLNFSPTSELTESVDLGSCGETSQVVARALSDPRAGFVPSRAAVVSGRLEGTLPAYSINVFDIRLSSPMKAAVDE
jgi:hypothetical protein